MSYFQLFIQNYGVELCFLLFYFRKQKAFKIILWVLLANALTHPWVVFGWLAIPSASLLKMLLLAEASSILIEAFIYHQSLRITFLNALLGSLLANLLSWQLSPLLSYALKRFYNA